MPIKSTAQLKMMFGAAKGNKDYGPSQSVAKEMLAKTPHKKKQQLMRMPK